jgi:hypothetical protein
MKQKTWILISALQAAVMVAIAVVAVVLGPCTAVLELANGSTEPMKCHWTYIAVTALAVAGAVYALVSCVLRTKEGRRIALTAQFFNLILIVSFPLFLIGTCGMPQMQCNITKIYVFVLAAVDCVLVLIAFAKADPAQVDRPREQV